MNKERRALLNKAIDLLGVARRMIERDALKALIAQREALRAQFRDEEAEIYERFHPAPWTRAKPA